MKVIYNSKLARILIPNFKMILIAFVLLCKKDESHYSQKDLLHEHTHSSQWTTLCLSSLIVFYILGLILNNYWWMLTAPIIFYIWYIVDWIFRVLLLFIKSVPSLKLGIKRYSKILKEIGHTAYRSVVFEQEAYAVEQGKAICSSFSFLSYY